MAVANHDLWRVRDITYNSHVRPFNTGPQSTRGNNGPKLLKRAFVVARLRRFFHAIAITAAAITSAAAVDFARILLMKTLLLLCEGGGAFVVFAFPYPPLARH